MDTAEGTYRGAVATSSSPFGAPPLREFDVTVVRPRVGDIAPKAIMRTLAGSFDIAGTNLPTTGLTVVPVGDSRSNCQPHNLTVNGLGVTCELYRVGAQTLEVRHGAHVLGTVVVNVGSNVSRVTWTSPSTADSGTVKFGETVTFSVDGTNLTADPSMGFAVEKCGVSNTELGGATDTLRRFTCLFNNDAGAVAGLMPGVVKDAPNGQVLLEGWSVPVETASVAADLLVHLPLNGDARDASGNSRDGIVSGAVPTTDRTGAAASAMQFNGSSSFIRIPGTAVPTTSALAVSAWVRLDRNIGVTQARIANRQSSGGGVESWGLEVFGAGYGGNSAGNRVVFHAGNGTTAVNAMSAQSLVAGRWYHVAGVHDGGQLRIYIDGVLDASIASVGPLYAANAADVVIGRSGPINDFWFPGAIDDVHLYGRALGAAEIASMGSPSGVGSTLTIDASEYVDGLNVAIDTQPGNTCRNGLLYNAPPYGEVPNAASWQFSVASAGTYRIEVEYAAAESRPVVAWVDDAVVSSSALGATTGGWCVTNTQRVVVGTLSLAAGAHTFRLSRTSVFPHVRRIFIIPASP